jgi:ABC-type antimicrobial peptide transport system permease subunit
MGLLARAFRSRRRRDWLAIAGIATCTILVLVIVSAFRSVSRAVVAYADQPGADLWVSLPGTDNLIRGTAGGLLSVDYVDSIRAVAGVADADPVLKGFMTVTTTGSGTTTRASLLSIGYRAPDGLGGPPALVAGRAPAGRREAAIDRAAAHRLGVTVGDTIAIANRRITVVGITRGTNLLATQFMFADIAASSLSIDTRDKTSFVVVRVAPESDPAIVADQISDRFPDLIPHSRAEFLANNKAEISSGFVPLLGLMGGLGVVAAAVLVSLLVSGATAERHEDIVVVFALGAGVPAVLGGMLRGTLRQVALGCGGGLLAAFSLAAGLDRWFPEIPLTLTGPDIIAVVAIFAVAGVLGAAVPMFALQSVDPMEAFRG